MEFKRDFEPLLKTYGIEARRIAVKTHNPNVVLEHAHQVIGDMLRTKGLENHEFNMEDPWTKILASVTWAICSSYHRTKGTTPSQLVVVRDMIIHDTSKTNYKAVHMRKAKDTLLNTASENRTRPNHKYQMGDYTFINKGKLPRRLKAPN